MTGPRPSSRIPVFIDCSTPFTDRRTTLPGRRVGTACGTGVNLTDGAVVLVPGVALPGSAHAEITTANASRRRLTKLGRVARKAVQLSNERVLAADQRVVLGYERHIGVVDGRWRATRVLRFDRLDLRRQVCELRFDRVDL